MSNLDATAARRSTFADNGSASWSLSSLLESPRPWWLATVLGVLAIAYGPLLWMFFDQQWQKPHYQFFPYVIGAFCWLLWVRWRDATPVASETALRSKAIRILQVMAASLLLFGLAIRSPWFAMISLIVLIASVFVRISESRRIINLWGIWILLWLMVPPPRNLDQTLITRLQSVSSRLSSYVLDTLSVDHLMDGNTLWLNSKQLFVDEACSGIISMLSIAACAVIFCVAKNRSPLHLALLALSSILWATIINVFRISIIAFAIETWGIDWSSGLPHESLSLVVFLVAFVILLCTDQVLLVCLSPIRREWHESQGSKIRFGERLASTWDWLVSFGLPGHATSESTVADAPLHRAATDGRHRWWTVPALFIPAAILQSVLLVSAFAISADRLPTVQTAVQFGPQSLPDELCGLHRSDFHPYQRGADSIQGKYSRTYQYTADDGMIYLVSFDFPFPGYWHELTTCYVAAGWHPVRRDVLTEEPAKSETRKWPYIEARFAKSGGQHGCLCFAEFDQFGVPYDPQAEWLDDSNTFWSSRNLYLRERQVFQVQVWSEGPTEWTPEQQQKAHELLLAARANIRSQIVGTDSVKEPPRSGSNEESTTDRKKPDDPVPAKDVSKLDTSNSAGDHINE